MLIAQQSIHSTYMTFLVEASYQRLCNRLLLYPLDCNVQTYYLFSDASDLSSPL